MSKDFRIVSIGAGNLANHLIPALADVGCTINLVYSRNLRNARSLALKVNAKSTNDLNLIDLNADLYLVMVHDDAIKKVVEALPTLNEKQFLAHTSGATPTDFLAKKAKNYGSCYPLQSFRKKKRIDMASIPFLIFGSNAKTTKIFRMLARQISPSVKQANDNDRLKYHLSAVFLNNFTNHLACLSYNFLKENDLSPKVLSSILTTTFDRIQNESPCDIQTGPAARGDKAVIKEHLKLIKEDPNLSAIYETLTKSIQQQQINQSK